jgi:glycosyltransferase involved in cell wall biosynthesis
MARRKVAPVRSLQFDLLWVNSWELAIEFHDLARRIPAAAVMDANPFTFNSQIRRRRQTGWKRGVSQYLHHRAFSRAAPAFDFFLPMGSDCADSLCEQYGIPRECCFVTLAPQDTPQWIPDSRCSETPRRLLFAGNDFTRKGGDFLLELFRTQLVGRYSLTIASNDPAVSARPLPEGVLLRRGLNREQMRQVYAENDIFLFPTQQDFMPQVVAEALTMGLPCIANNVGGIRDLVHEGKTGFLMEVGASPTVWAERIDRLSQICEFRRMSANARKFAEDMLDVRRFDTMIADVVKKMLGGFQSPVPRGEVKRKSRATITKSSYPPLRAK